MTVNQVVEQIKSGGALIAVSLAIIMSLIQITPIKFNPWTALARLIGKAINGGDVMGILQTHITDTHRYRILRFNASLLEGKPQSKEEFDEILYSIDCYEKYCAAHPEYQNNRCVLAVRNIKREYENMMANHRFLEYTNREGR